MGKIFDALEKANKQSTIKNVVLHASDRISNRYVEEEKVVPLLHARLANSNTQDLDDKLIMHHAPQSLEASFFKVLKTNLLFPAVGKPAKSILVTSAIPGDGKSFISANIAISIAQGIEEHVLLIDCDMRRPTIHKYFGISQEPGLSSFLTNENDIAPYLVKTSIAKLTVLPSGQPPTNPTELLTATKMKNLLEQVKLRYDDRFIVLDSPPPSMAPETTAIAKQVDGVLLVVRAGKTPKDAVSNIIELIGKEKIVGIVLNDCEQSVKKYYGYAKSYYKGK